LADIASASRLDAELSRGEAGPVDVASLLAALVDVHGATAGEGAPRLELEPIVAASTKGGLGKGGLGKGGLIVVGIEERLGQVLRNLIANAVSFSPPGGTIRLSARALAGTVEIAIDDEGPGIPENKLEQTFERFYSERPKSEKFGTHSGLGLAISRQIVEAHNGTLQAFNRRDEAGRVIGARFVLRLPAE
jgi:two-component system sensor histidine kinase ChvG